MHEKTGYVYVITNKWLPGLTKLGETQDVERRFREISSVLPGRSVLRWSRGPLPCRRVESQVRDVLSPLRVKGSRDWFNVGWRVAVQQFELVISGSEPSVLRDLKLTDETKVSNARDAGRFCREWRRNAGVTQAALAEAAGVGIRFVVDFERGKPTCQLEKAIRLCQTIGVDFHALKRSS